MDRFDNKRWNLSYLQNLQIDIDEYICNDADRVSEIEFDFQHNGNHYQNLMLKNNQEGNEALVDENIRDIFRFIEFLLIDADSRKGFLEKPYKDVIRSLTNMITAKDIYERYICKQAEVQHGENNTLPDKIQRIKEMRADGYKLREIAAELGITINQLKYIMYIKYNKTDFAKLTLEQKLERRYRNNGTLV